MSEFLPKEVREGLEAARKKTLRKTSRLRVRIDGQIFPILRLWDDGFAVARENAEHLRGLVDIFDGARHLYQALIVASQEDDFEMIFDFKRSTAAIDGPPLDYDVLDDAPVALIAHH